MTSFLEAIGSAVRQSACGNLAAQDTVITFVSSLVGSDGGLYASAVRGLRRSLCGNPSDAVTPPPAPNPFENAPGPPPGCTGSTGFWYYYEDFVNPSQNRWIFRSYPFQSQSPTVSNFRNNGGNNGRVDIVDGSSIVNGFLFQPGGRADGQWRASDFRLCLPGSSQPQVPTNDPNFNPPPPQIPPYVPQPDSRPVTYDGPNGPVTENVSITIFAPVVIAPLTIVAPVTINGPNFNLKGEVRLSPNFDIRVGPEINFNVGGHPNAPPPPPVAPPPKIGEDGDGDGEEEEENPPPPPEGRIIGALVTATDAVGGRCTLIGQGENPDIYAPGLGHVSFLVQLDGARGWTNDIKVKNTRCYVPCPVPQGAILVRGTPDPGYSFVVTPVYDRPPR